MLLLVASLALCGSLANAGIFSSSSCSGKTVPSGVCALLFDDDDCGGWEYQVPRGYSELSWGITGPRKNDTYGHRVSTLLNVIPVCVVVAYEPAAPSDQDRLGVVLSRARESPAQFRVASWDLVLPPA